MPLPSVLPSNGRTNSAKYLLSAALNVGDPFALASGITVTPGTAGAGSLISGGVRVAPAKISSTLIDVANGQFAITGVIPGAMSVSSADMCRPNILTNGAGQAARWRPVYSAIITGSTCEVYFRGLASTIVFRAFVGRRPVTASMQSFASAAGNRHFIKIDFPAYGRYQVDIEVTDGEFGGFVIEKTGNICQPVDPRPSINFFGDSYWGGASGVAEADSNCRVAAKLLGANVFNTSIGGTGYLTSPGVFDRISPDVVATNADVVVFGFSQNDQAQFLAGADFAGEVERCLNRVLTLMPNSWVVCSHISNPTGHSTNAARSGMDRAMRSVSDRLGVSYISMVDPRNQILNAIPWVASGAAYLPGDVRTVNGWAWTSTATHSSAASFATDLAAGRWVFCGANTGTGRVGATASDGNGDDWVHSDTIHLTANGHFGIGYELASELVIAARKFVGLQ
jgi:hypothetical protein